MKHVPAVPGRIKRAKCMRLTLVPTCFMQYTGKGSPQVGCDSVASLKIRHQIFSVGSSASGLVNKED